MSGGDALCAILDGVECHVIVAERSFAHCLGTGGIRRIHLRRLENIRKRYIVHVAGFNLGIVIRKLLGAGTPRGMAGLKRLVRPCLALLKEPMALRFADWRAWEVRHTTFTITLAFARGK